VENEKRLITQENEGLRRGKARDEKRAAQKPLRHSAESDLATRPLRRVTLPLVCSKQPETAALDNAKIFEIIPFPQSSAPLPRPVPPNLSRPSGTCVVFVFTESRSGGLRSAALRALRRLRQRRGKPRLQKSWALLAKS
jgi:hypothetical protein